MPLQQFQQDNSPRAQRMTADEAKSVIDLWQQEQNEQTGLTDKPAVPDVAEGLNIRVEDVQRLLAEVRARRVAEEAQLAQEQERSAIQLAEEERKLAEARRQRAELLREQSEAERQRAEEEQWRRETYPQRPTLYTRRATGNVGYKVGGVVLGLVIWGVIWSLSHPQPPHHMTISQASWAYDASGRIENYNATCTDDTTGEELPCDDATIAYDKDVEQRAHDQEVAAAKKQPHDRRPHR